jgi:dienelactone hydrolase
MQAMRRAPVFGEERSVEIPLDSGQLAGSLVVPAGAVGLVLLAHGSGSARHSPRIRQVAAGLARAGLATLLFDLLTDREGEEDHFTARLRFDISLLSRRLVAATDWAEQDQETAVLPLGYLGSSTGAAAALVAAGGRPEVAAVVSRGGRPDLAGEALRAVRAPTLFIVGGEDLHVLALNRLAMGQMVAPVELEIIPHASHLFEEPGTMERVVSLAAEWLRSHLGTAGGRRRSEGPALQPLPPG